ncbi:hypothetical protein FPV67DRAFT_1452690 [Lyophyllum atratum]|nr:hypothetical protein FPV67DRAFT_1452690 [Lyophyllum atratum]
MTDTGGILVRWLLSPPPLYTEATIMLLILSVLVVGDDGGHEEKPNLGAQEEERRGVTPDFEEGLSLHLESRGYMKERRGRQFLFQLERRKPPGLDLGHAMLAMAHTRMFLRAVAGQKKF